MSLSFYWSSATAGGLPESFGSDSYLAWADPLPVLADRLERVRREAVAGGRHVSCGIRLHLVARERAEDAWAEAARLHGGSPDQVRDLEVAPNLWSGLRGPGGEELPAGAGTALVGSWEEVAERISEYADLGVDHFVLSAHAAAGEDRLDDGFSAALARRGLVEAAGLAG